MMIIWLINLVGLTLGGLVLWVLSWLLSLSEVKHIIKDDWEFLAKQLRLQHPIVNRYALKSNEISQLIGCPLTSLNLRPWRYCYEKVSSRKVQYSLQVCFVFCLCVGTDLYADIYECSFDSFWSSRLHLRGLLFCM